MIFYIQGFCSEGRYGAHLNKHISYLPDDAWICVTDLDVATLLPDAMIHVEHAIEDHPDAVLMSCVTNRLGMPRFTVSDEMFEEYDIRKHIKFAQKRPERQYSEIEGIVPGFFMLFPKSTWIKHPFDDKPLIVEGDATFDIRWSRQIEGKKILIEGLYVFHIYRLGMPHGRWDTDHLL